MIIPTLAIAFLGILFALVSQQVQGQQASSPMNDLVHADWVMSSLFGCVIVTDQAGFVSYLNDNASQRLLKDQIKPEKLHINDLLHSGHDNLVLSPAFLKEWMASQEEKAFSYFPSVLIETSDLGVFYADLRISLLDHETQSFVWLLDMEAEHASVFSRLETQMSQAPLTSLIGYGAMERHIDQVLRLRLGKTRFHSLAHITLDNLDHVGDGAGSPISEMQLLMVGDTLSTTVRQSDKLAEIGRGTFLILLEDCRLEKASSLMEHALADINQLNLSIQGGSVPLLVSIGLIEFDSKRQQRTPELLYKVKSACLKANELGGNQVCVYVADKKKSPKTKSTDWAAVLESAMRYDHFQLYVQPVVALGAEPQKTHRYEVLLRLPYKNTLLSPGGFLPAADRLGMMAKIDRWIISQVVRKMSACQAMQAQSLCLMINLSAQAVQDKGFLTFLKHKANEHNINPALLCFEIAESVAIANLTATRHLMDGLSSLGFKLTLDDFGSGFSSLSYLRDLPLSYLKIDGNFIHNLVTNPVDVAMVKAVHEVGQVMQLKTIAELVEDEDTLTQLRVIGVDFAQGYYCGKPFPFADLCSRDKPGSDLKNKT